jgi:dTDP-4-dehydrorhamnose reductase
MGTHRLNSSRPVWITGAGGLIGSHLLRLSFEFAPGILMHGLSRQELDLTDFAVVRRRFQRDRPQLVIHCAALTKTVHCEEDPVLARKLNVEATATLCELVAEVPFVFFSSDMVFDGRRGNYDESAAVNPIGVYGQTKAAAERIVLANPMHTVIRTSLNGGVSPSGDRGFNEEMRRAWQSGRVLRLFIDEFRCPTPAIVTARAVWELVMQNCAGLYHVAGSEKLSRWEIGQLVAARWPELHPKIEPATAKDYVGAPRPADTSLNCGKVQGLLSFRLPKLTQWLADHPEEPF